VAGGFSPLILYCRHNPQANVWGGQTARFDGLDQRPYTFFLCFHGSCNLALEVLGAGVLDPSVATK
jgi:hypothetical protein